jgi:hypothetical protein
MAAVLGERVPVAVHLGAGGFGQAIGQSNKTPSLLASSSAEGLSGLPPGT